jgi:putative tricarboxylic transport membrane protein
MAGSTFMGMILLALGIFVGFQGIDLSLGTPGHPGPGFVPLGLGVILILLAAVYLWQSSRGKEKKKTPSSPSDYWRTGMAVGTISLYAFAVSWLGYILTTFLFFVIWLSLIERKKWLQTASLACLAVAAVYFFNILFSVQLPSGLLKGIIR